MARVQSSTQATRVELSGWQMADVAAGAATVPAQLAALSPQWQAAQAPGSVASALRTAGRFVAATAAQLDERDWWFRCRFARSDVAGARAALRFGGLATLATVFLDGSALLESDNLFREHEVELPPGTGGESELYIRCRSVAVALKLRRPRPRWKARMFENQNLRYVRTSALGRVPFWAPATPLIGPWRPIALLQYGGARVEEAEVRAHALEQGGALEARIRVSLHEGRLPTRAALRSGAASAQLSIEAAPDGCALLRGTLALPDAQRWWPHTHGAQPLYDVALELDGELLQLGRTGFRTVELHRDGGRFELAVNGTRLFCRGACWTTADLLTLGGDPAPLLRDARAAGMNLLRLPGTSVYETDRFYALCDELGLLVWQDFMFGNFDYPADDAAFLADVRAEATQQLSRLQLAPCLAVLCGSSEVPQAAGMNGIEDAAQAGSALFRELLPELSRAARPDVPYVATSTSASRIGVGVSDGPAHYYGVGGYLRPLSDVRRSAVRFASECLALAHVPVDRTLDAFLPSGAGPVHHPAWKAGVPRDGAVGWDFDDVRDHYLRELFGSDPLRLRSEDIARYLEASRIVTGELSAQVIAELRTDGCAGAVIWTLSDLVPGAGWGLVDARGERKPAWYFVRRAFTSQLQLTDEGLNGLRLHAFNESDRALEATLRIQFVRDGDVVVATGERALTLAPQQVSRVGAEELVGRFLDSAYAYRFGPRGYDLASALLLDRASGAVLGEAAHFPGRLPLERGAQPELSGALELQGEGAALLTLHSARLATWVALDAGAWVPEDNYFHVLPGAAKTVRLHAPEGSRAALGLTALPFNARSPLRVSLAGGR